MKKISQIALMVVVCLMLVGCATTTNLGSAGTLNAGFCMQDVPKYFGWLSCDKPLINFEADILSNEEADEEPSDAAMLGKIHIIPTPAELHGVYPYMPTHEVYPLDAFSHTEELRGYSYQDNSGMVMVECINGQCWEAVAEGLRH